MRGGALEWWFSGTQAECQARWFQANPVQRQQLDRYIVHTFGNVFHQAPRNAASLMQYYSNIDQTRDRDLLFEAVETIIVLDQFSRHIHRDTNETNETNETNQTNQTVIHDNTHKAASLALEVLSKHENVFGVLNQFELSFVLMPLKHYDTVNCFDYIHECLKAADYASPDKRQLFRFYKDLIWRYGAHLNEKTVRKSCQRWEQQQRWALWTDYNDITEFNTSGPKIGTGLVQSELYQVLRKQLVLREPKVKRVVVSLSGGVDSNTLAFLLARLRDELHFELKAYHYNGRNRLVTDKEADFVREFCSILWIPLYVRVISEIHRRENDREFYEDYTRDIRFDMYRRLSSASGASVVVLGHTRDDTEENIWTNFANGRDLFHLRKMSIFDEQQNVTLFRPFLGVEKTTILQFAHAHAIPYLLNTTPPESNRGKFRNEFKPAIEKQYGTSAHKGVEFLAESLQEYFTFLNAQLFEPFMSSVVPNRFGVAVPISFQHVGLGMHFWQTVLRDILIIFRFNVGVPSKKCLKNFVRTIRAKKYGQITLKKDLYVRYEPNGTLFILARSRIVESGLLPDFGETTTVGTKEWDQIQKSIK